MKNKDFKEQCRVELHELAGGQKEEWSWGHETFSGFLLEKCEREFDCPQVSDYSIVGHGPSHIIFEIEGHEEEQ